MVEVRAMTHARRADIILASSVRSVDKTYKLHESTSSLFSLG